jgi:hypothetical protein
MMECEKRGFGTNVGIFPKMEKPSSVSSQEKIITIELFLISFAV